MATTPHLGMTLVEQSQAQKEVTVNMALMRIDALLNSSALDKDLSTPPAEPEEGDVYIVGAGATGDWAGKEKSIAYFEQIWRFITPNEGLMLWVQDEDAFYVFDGSDWGLSSSGGGGGGEANTGQNANGDAGGVFKHKSSASLVFNNIVAGSNVTVTGGGAGGGDIVISSSGGGGGAANLDGLGDVTITSATEGDVLVYDNTAGAWENRALALADISDAGALAGQSSVDNADWSGAALAVGNGGTGRSSVTADCLLRGNGSSALQESGVKVDNNDGIHGFRSVVKQVTSTSYTLLAADTGKIVECANAGAITVALPATLPQGFTVTVVQKGAGQVTFSPASGASCHNRSGYTKTAGLYAVCTLYVSSNAGGSSAAYILAGDGE